MHATDSSSLQDTLVALDSAFRSRLVVCCVKCIQYGCLWPLQGLVI